MIGVKFTRAMRPYGQGDVAFLPEDIAQGLVDGGEAELVDLPNSPHAHEAGFRPAVTKPAEPAPTPAPAPQRGRIGFRTKGK
jgi:hypothetical protein